MAVGLGLGLPFGGSNAWSPSLLMPEIWLDPSDLLTMKQEITGASATTAAAVDSPVGSILNKGSGADWWVAPANGQRPILRHVGSSYYLEFDGVDDTLGPASALSASVVTVGLAFKRTSSATIQALLTLAQQAIYAVLTSSPASWGVYLGGNVLSSYDAATKLVAIARFRAANDVDLITNGVIENKTTGTAYGTYVSHLSFPGISQDFGGEVYGVVAKSAAISAANVASLNVYLAGKAGL